MILNQITFLGPVILTVTYISVAALFFAIISE